MNYTAARRKSQVEKLSRLANLPMYSNQIYLIYKRMSERASPPYLKVLKYIN